MRKTIKLLLLFGVLTFTLSGCWDKIEVRELGIVLGMGIDYMEGEEPIRLTLQTVKPNGQQSAESKAGSGDDKFETLIVRGHTVFDAYNNIQKTSQKKVIFPHSKIIIIGRKVAEQGVASITDYLLREREIRPTSWIAVANTTASEMLESSLSVGAIPSAGLVTMMEGLRTSNLTHPTPLIEFYMRMQGDSQASIIPLIRKDGKHVKFEQTAVFFKDKMVGTISINETRGLLWLENRLVKGNVTFPYKNSSGNLLKNVSVEISKGHTRIIPRFTAPSEITIDIECRATGNIREAEIKNATMFNAGEIEQLEKATEAVISKRIEMTILKAQKEIKVDFIGFEEKFHNAYPKQWRELENDWLEIFPSIKTNVKVDIEINRQGVTKNPLQL
jgi:spore germination protein KC